MMPNVADLYTGRPMSLPEPPEVETKARGDSLDRRSNGLVARIARMSRTLLALFL